MYIIKLDGKYYTGKMGRAAFIPNLNDPPVVVFYDREEAEAVIFHKRVNEMSSWLDAKVVTVKPPVLVECA
jgi:hypothetical protein